MLPSRARSAAWQVVQQQDTYNAPMLLMLLQLAGSVPLRELLPIELQAYHAQSAAQVEAA
jgi:hypothetical protein